MLATYVRAGIAALDAVNPAWPLVVSEHTVDVSSDTRCPLGQLWGRFSRGLKALGIPEDDAALYGFDSPAALGLTEGSPAEEYEALSRMWRYAVRVRTDFPVVKVS